MELKLYLERGGGIPTIRNFLANQMVRLWFHYSILYSKQKLTANGDIRKGAGAIGDFGCHVGNTQTL